MVFEFRVICVTLYRMKKKKSFKEDTALVHAGRDHTEYFGILNPPVVRASSIVFPTLESYTDRGLVKHWYGRTGTPHVKFSPSLPVSQEADHKHIFPS